MYLLVVELKRRVTSIVNDNDLHLHSVLQGFISSQIDQTKGKHGLFLVSPAQHIFRSFPFSAVPVINKLATKSHQPPTDFLSCLVSANKQPGCLLAWYPRWSSRFALRFSLAFGPFGFRNHPHNPPCSMLNSVVVIRFENMCCQWFRPSGCF